MHAAIYRKHDEAQAIVHTHSDHCVAVSCHLRPLPGFHYPIGTFGGDDMPCVPYSTFGTQALADDAAEALTHRTACLLGNHGMICRAPTLTQAVNQAQRLEIMCRQYALARQLGEPRLLTDAEWRQFFDRDNEPSTARAFSRGSGPDRRRAGKCRQFPIAGGVLPCREPSAGEAAPTADAQGSAGNSPSPGACFHASA